MSKLTTDRYTVGFIAGTIAGFIADLSSLVMTHLFKFGKIGYEDFAAVLMFGAPSFHPGGDYLCPFGAIVLFCVARFNLCLLDKKSHRSVVNL